MRNLHNAYRRNYYIGEYAKRVYQQLTSEASARAVKDIKVISEESAVPERVWRFLHKRRD
ncbi:hypothetical protein [[Clostridium] hylemonae]|uniref:hypothetical protein n=1 Tax=[Clostridium] hylemonae TaxID=89153 RepID=UPI0011C7FB6F|nr:hypothetical protein [[Clostridium] hylemonae]